jgi:terminal uridylyltransferase
MSGDRVPIPVALEKLLEKASISDPPSQERPSKTASYQHHQQHGQYKTAKYANASPFGPRYPQRNQNFGNSYPPPPQSLPLTAFMRPSPAVSAAFSEPSVASPVPPQQLVPQGGQLSFPPQTHTNPRQRFGHSSSNGSWDYSAQHGQSYYNKSVAAQDAFLEELLKDELPKVIASQEEIYAKYDFLASIQSRAYAQFLIKFSSNSRFNLVPYGSIESGFATKGSDVDAVVVWDRTCPPPSSEELEALPRLLEEIILDNNWGARLLPNTRVPVLKVCQKPSPELLQALRDERQKWEFTREDEGIVKTDRSPIISMLESPMEKGYEESKKTEKDFILEVEPQSYPELDDTTIPKGPVPSRLNKTLTEGVNQVVDLVDANNAKDTDTNQSSSSKTSRWRRERPAGPLDYPVTSEPLIDISFSTELGILNTKLLRCYSVCDRRLVEMVHFIKSWAKRNKIASAYNGTLCSYGWVLMILHYLINIVTPPVLPNLQLDYPHFPLIVNDVDVGFFDNPTGLIDRAQKGMLFGRAPLNTQSTSSLLRGFFHYYAHQGPRVIGGGFRWRENVICLRTPGGLVTKTSKGWTSSASTTVNGLEVKQRYLLAIECPIEVGHNVARTVVHHGVVGIRDELRRTWAILEAVRHGQFPYPGKGLFDYQGDAESNDHTAEGAEKEKDIDLASDAPNTANA